MGSTCKKSADGTDQAIHSTKKQVINDDDDDQTAISNENIRSIYQFEKSSVGVIILIGKGGFGTVRKAFIKGNPSKIFAVKTISKEKIKKDLHMLIRELKIFKSLDHPNIVKFYETYQEDRFFHLVMEYCSGGELHDKVEAEGFLEENYVAPIVKKIVSAVHYLHEKGICHRDLKPENFIFQHSRPDAEIKIIDFGLATHFDPLETNCLTSLVGTAFYLAPEVLKQKYDFRCDNWSLGVITYNLLSGRFPFEGSNQNELFKKIQSGKYKWNGDSWKKVSKQAQDFIKQLLQKDPKKRFTTSQALEHPWIASREEKKQTQTKAKVDKQVIALLRNFKQTSRFKREALRVMVNLLNENELKQLQENFQIIDSDRSGMISLQELTQAIKDCEIPNAQQEAKQIMDQLNLDPNGELNYSEFIAATLDTKLYLNSDNLWAAFKYFDIDNRNYVTNKNLRDALVILNKARSGRKYANLELDQWIREIDEEHGRVTFDQFVDMMKNIYSQSKTIEADDSIDKKPNKSSKTKNIANND